MCALYLARSYGLGYLRFAYVPYVAYFDFRVVVNFYNSNNIIITRFSDYLKCETSDAFWQLRTLTVRWNIGENCIGESDYREYDGNNCRNERFFCIILQLFSQHNTAPKHQLNFLGRINACLCQPRRIGCHQGLQER